MHFDILNKMLLPVNTLQQSGLGKVMMKLVLLSMMCVVLGCCAPGGGIGLEAVLHDKTCQESGLTPGTKEYMNCRLRLHEQVARSNAAMQAYYLRQQEIAREQLQRTQTCNYNGSNIGGITSGTMTCY